MLFKGGNYAPTFLRYNNLVLAIVTPILVSNQNSHKFMDQIKEGTETIQRKKLFKGGNYMRKYSMFILESRVGTFRDKPGRDVPVSLCPGTKKNSCPGVPLSRNKGRSKCPRTNSSVPGRPGTK